MAGRAGSVDVFAKRAATQAGQRWFWTLRPKRTHICKHMRKPERNFYGNLPSTRNIAIHGCHTTTAKQASIITM